MAAGIESEAVFRARALQLDVPGNIMDLIVGAGVKSMGAFAWSSSFQPGQTDESPFVTMIEGVLTRAPTLGELTALRRLYYESHTVSLSEMRSRVERTDDSRPARLQPAERAARHNDQQQRINGFNLSGPYECSHSFIDKIFQMLDDNVLRYISLDEITTREQELMGTKKDADVTRMIEENKDGLLRAVRSAKEPEAELDSDLRIKEAFIRRGLAFDQAGLLTFAVHQTWVEDIFHRLAEPAPEHYKQLTMKQAISADKRLFIKMAEDTRSGIVPALGQPRPLDDAMKKWSVRHEVVFLLSPLPGGSNQNKGKGKQVFQTWSDDGPYAAPKSKGKGKGKGKKGKVKGKSKGKGFDLPPGCVSSTPDGRRICFSYNRPGGCQAGANCNRGAHICGKPGCFGNHPAYDCPV